MRTRTSATTCVALILWFVTGVHAKTIYVSLVGANVTPTAPYGSWAESAKSLPVAYSVAVEGDTIILTNGTHYIGYYVNVTNAVTIRGATDNFDDTRVHNDQSLKYGGINTGRSVVFALNNPGAVLAGLSLTGGMAYHPGSYGAGVVISGGGTVTNCHIYYNTICSGGSGVALMSSDALVTHCVINNNGGAATGGGVYATAGTIANCLIRYNLANSGAGIYCNGTSVRVLNCTVVDNESNTSSGAGGMHYVAGAVTNCVYALNRAYFYTGASGNDLSVSSGKWAAFSNNVYRCAFDEAWPLPNDNCITFVPDFTNATNNDYHVGVGSPLVNAGATYDGIAQLDLDMLTRNFNGAPDIGCYECQDASFSAGITARPEHIMQGGSSVLSARAVNAPAGASVAYDWTVTGPGGTFTHTGETFGKTYDVHGYYTVQVVVRDTIGLTQSEPAVRTDYLHVGALTNYVSLSSSSGVAPTPPYNTWATSAKSLRAAYDEAVDGATIILTNGEHIVSPCLIVLKSVAIRGLTGNFADVTVRNNQSSRTNPYTGITADNTQRSSVFALHSENAVLSGISITGGMSYGPSENGVVAGGVIIMSRGGTVTNCRIHANDTSSTGSGVSLYSSKALVTHCVIDGNTCSSSGGKGSAAYVITGTLDNSLIHGNISTKVGPGGVAVGGSNARVVNCTVVDNSSSTTSYAGGLHFYSAGALTNCVFAGNTAVNFVPGSRGTFSYGGTEWTADYSAINYTGNNLIYQRALYTAISNGVTHCAFPCESLPNPNCFTFTPDWADAANNDYHPNEGNFLIDGGILHDGICATDLDNNTRVVNNVPDIGCYECQTVSTFSAEVTAIPEHVMQGGEAVLRARPIQAEPEAVFEYDWTVTGPAISEPITGYGEEFTNRYDKAGYYTVQVVVYDTANGINTGPVVRENYLHIGALTNYVVIADAEGVTPAPPYQTWQTAAKSIHDAYAESLDGATIILSDGEHKLDKVIAVLKAVDIVGQGIDITEIKHVHTDEQDGYPGGSGVVNPCTYLFNVNNAAAKIRRMTLKDGNNRIDSAAASCVNVTGQGGTVEECRMTGNRNNWGGGLGTVSITSSDGRVTRCIIDNNIGPNGAGAKLSAGMLDNCLVISNTADSFYDSARATGIAVIGSGAKVYNCTVADNKSTSTGEKAALYYTAGTVRNCNFANNTCVVTNTATVPAWMTTAPTAFSNNVTYCAYDIAAAVIPGHGNVLWTGDFADAYRLPKGSALKDAGLCIPDWSLSATDLDGNPRVKYVNATGLGFTDIGCYESKYIPSATLFLIK